METFERISVQKAHEIMDLGETNIVDIRDAASFAQGHIAKAQNVSDENIDDFLKTADKDKPLLCCCYHGISSQRAAGFFITQGFEQVYSIDGGWEGWKAIYG